MADAATTGSCPTWGHAAWQGVPRTVMSNASAAAVMGPGRVPTTPSGTRGQP